MRSALPPCQAGVPTPPEVQAEIVRLRLAGASRRQIMAATGCGRSTVDKMVKKHGLPAKGPAAHATPEERVEAIRQMFVVEGKSYAEISDALGMSRNSVAGIVFRKGFTRDDAVNIANQVRARAENGRKAQYNLELGRVVGVKRPRPQRPSQPAPIKIGSTNGHVYKMPEPRDLPKFTGATPQSNPKPWLERLSGECTWPVSGEGADTFSCCAPVTPGTCWCEDHNRTGRSNWRSAKGGYHSEPKSFVAELVRRFAA
jgi:GcrA cell cycle regulator